MVDDWSARIVHGDCIEAMAAMEPESVDAVVCDPPYGLEFMGKEWDKFRAGDDPTTARWRGARAGTQGEAEHTSESRGGYGRVAIGGGQRSRTSRCLTCGKRDAFRNPHDCGDATEWATEVVNPQGTPPTMAAFQNWCEAWALAAYRVLKPGGHLLAFGGTRTYHRLAAGVEDAGFEIRDSLHWIYGCLTSEVEVLTEHGWKSGIDVRVGERIATWDPETEAVALAGVQETFQAPYSGPMRAIRNDDTDQLVTPNHRVYHRTRQRKQRDGVRTGSWPAAWNVADADTVSRNQPTRFPLSGFADGPGVGGVDYARLLGFVWTEGSYDRTGSGVRVYQSASANGETVKGIDRLFKRAAPLHRRYDRERVYESRVRGNVLVAETTWFMSGEVAGRVRRDLPAKMPTYELLWRMTLAEKVAFMEAAMLGDGSGNCFEQKGRAPLDWFQTLFHLIGWSARVTMRRDRETGCCSLRRRGTTEMQSRHFRAAPDEHYDGDVWCVRVPTGAFVARRNGRVFVTGNSGFPKSLDVSKAIDKAAGAERPIIETIPDRWAGKGSVLQRATQDERIEAHITAPATADARAWNGWGTALQPAHEPIVLARKPLAGTVAETVLAHGTGALNVKACEVGTQGGTTRGDTSGNRRSDGKAFDTGHDVVERDGGRWPSNVLLGHLLECDGSGAAHTDVLCAPGCPVAELNEASGQTASRRAELTSTPGSVYGGGAGLPSHSGVYGFDDEGGAARFFYVAKPRRRERVGGTIRNLHPTVKPIDLMRYLVRLVTPPGGVVLDPFLGSGTTGCAAMVEGFRFIGIEADRDSYETALARVSDYAFANGRVRPSAA